MELFCQLPRRRHTCVVIDAMPIIAQPALADRMTSRRKWAMEGGLHPHLTLALSLTDRENWMMEAKQLPVQEHLNIIPTKMRQKARLQLH